MFSPDWHASKHSQQRRYHHPSKAVKHNHATLCTLQKCVGGRKTVYWLADLSLSALIPMVMMQYACRTPWCGGIFPSGLLPSPDLQAQNALRFIFPPMHVHMSTWLQRPSMVSSSSFLLTLNRHRPPPAVTIGQQKAVVPAPYQR